MTDPADLTPNDRPKRARCDELEVVVGVNQNMRYDQSVRAAKDVLNRGGLGEVVLATIDMWDVPHWMPWAEGMPSSSTFVMGVHHLDTFRRLPSLRNDSHLAGFGGAWDGLEHTR